MYLITNSKGFTLIELVISIAIAAILAGIAAPSFIELIKDNRLTAQINMLSASLNLARSEAIRRSIPVTICLSNNQSSCGGSWQDGWIVFEDLDDDGSADESETIIRVQGALNNDLTLNFNGGSNITYETTGFSSDAGTFMLCDDRGAINGKGLALSLTGRVRTEDSLVEC